MPAAPRKTAAAKKAAAAPPPEPPAGDAEQPDQPPADTRPRIQPAEVDISKPDEQLNVVQAIAEVMRRIGAVGKDRTNDDQGFKFRGVDDLMNAAHPAMAAVGLVCLPDTVLECTTGLRATRSGGTLYEVRVHMRFMFHGPDGSKLPAEAWGEGVDNFDKATSKAHTMAYKTCIFQSFHVPTAEASQRDPDASSGGGEESRRVFPAEERWNAVKDTIPESKVEAFRAWWREQGGFPKQWGDWTDDQIAAMEAKVAEVIAEAESEAAKAAQDAAGSPDEPAGADDTAGQPSEPQEPAQAVEEPPSNANADPAGSDSPLRAAVAAAQAEQQALEPDSIEPPAGDAPPPYDEAKLREHRRKALLVAGTPNRAAALGRMWREIEPEYRELEIEDPGGTRMPLWRLFVALGYPPAGEGYDV